MRSCAAIWPAPGTRTGAREHRLELMADDYRRVVQDAAAAGAAAHGLPSHFTDDYRRSARSKKMGVEHANRVTARRVTRR